MSLVKGPIDQFEDPSLARILFLIAIFGGAAIRIVAVSVGDIGIYVDGALRISMAMKWAADPGWMGLTGIWPWSHIYFLGALISIWNQPVIIAKLIGVIAGVITILVFRIAVRHRFGATTAALATLFLAFYWTHIWLSTAYWVEIPYLLFLFLAVDFAERTAATQDSKNAFIAGLFLALALLLRHEVVMVVVLFAGWVWIHTKNAQLVRNLMLLPGCLLVWYFIEPMMSGRSYFDYFRFVDQFKQMEMVVGHVSRSESLTQWVLMLGASPTLLVVVPGLYGLWKYRRDAVKDLLAWMFVSQFVFHFMLTLTSGWRPQLRYILLQFINLLPYAALVWLQITRRFSPRVVLPVGLAAMIAMQTIGWWVGRNNRLPGGWLPVQVVNAPQQKVDQFLAQLISGPHQRLKIRSAIPGPRWERWSLEHSFVVNKIAASSIDFAEVDVHAQPEVMSGTLPTRLTDGDLILIDPAATFYPAVIKALVQQKPELVRKALHSHVEVILFSDEARKADLLIHSDGVLR